jgi:hypothetical protein
MIKSLRNSIELCLRKKSIDEIKVEKGELIIKIDGKYIVIPKGNEDQVLLASPDTESGFIWSDNATL